MQSLHQFDWSLRDMEFLLWEQFKIDTRLLQHEALAEPGINRELLTTLLHQARQFALRELDPINIAADQEGCSLDKQGKVHIPEVFTKAWQQYKSQTSEKYPAFWNEIIKSRSSNTYLINSFFDFDEFPEIDQLESFLMMKD